MSKTFLSTLTLIATILITAACDKGNPYEDFTQEQLSKSLSKKYQTILALAQPISCDDPSEWLIADIESVCGSSHLAYHESVDKRKLTALIRDHDLLIEIYRPMIAPLIDCLGYREPKGVICEEGKAIVEYERQKK